ncbi:MAG: M20/M25/M40 family metallo-hydrolase [Gemmatimonadetes bacterium]|nr:M20/M25/M40 family metallo-hydrolase [Gemmatimonadota bacterium]
MLRRKISFAALILTVSMSQDLLQAQAVPDLTEELRVARQTLSSPQVQRAFEYVEGSESETVQEWLSLCNAYGPSGEEIKRSRLLFKLFRIYGLENVHIDDALNVIGVRPGVGEGPTVVLNAHHDNVSLWPADQPVEAFVADGRVWCPAAGDDLMGITQMLTVLRALNAANIETMGDLWFVALTGEEAPIGPVHADASRGSEQLVRANVPHNLDWRRGDILVQFHGRGGEGVNTGSTPVRNRTQLRVFVSFERDRWAPHAVDALGRIIARIGPEVRDPRSTRVPFERTTEAPLPPDVLFMNMGMIWANEIISRPASEAWIRFDMRADREVRLLQAHEAIRRIAEEELAKMGDEFSYVYEINSKNGIEGGIEGWDMVDNPPARMAAAAAQALYGTTPVINASTGCGDCVRAYLTGMPAFSFTGNVTDFGGGRFEVGRGSALESAVRRRTVSHDVTESAEIVRLWSGIKHGLLFAVAYVGMAGR